MYYLKMKGICINILREDKAVVDDLALKYLDKGKRYDYISLSEIEEEFSNVKKITCFRLGEDFRG